ncbi:hypothetical protein FA13DRAFT_1795699 [Coprinellus micaceus]|uniref:Uncharacterized protein n=1 Tax=Coprinellus micaceus TaxID=71717 RepID=A0A4Y7SXF3_COPMI|nr:hypothetical protein FA13DRAFT_1795699 [Coprinellus micaceus]
MAPSPFPSPLVECTLFNRSFPSMRLSLPKRRPSSVNSYIEELPFCATWSVCGAAAFDGQWTASIGAAEGGRERKPSGMGSSRRVCFLQKNTDARKSQHTEPSTHVLLDRPRPGELEGASFATCRLHPASLPTLAEEIASVHRILHDGRVHPRLRHRPPYSITKGTTCEDPKSRSLQDWNLKQVGYGWAYGHARYVYASVAIESLRYPHRHLHFAFLPSFKCHIPSLFLPFESPSFLQHLASATGAKAEASRGRSTLSFILPTTRS